MEDSALQELLKTIDRSVFKNLPFIKRVDKPWGYELIFTSEDLPYTGKLMHINAGKRLSLQVHDKKQETQILISGKCNSIIENVNGEMETIEMIPLQGYTMMIGQKHRLQAVEDCDVFEVSTPEIGNTFRLEDDYARPTETDEMRKDPNRGWSN